MLDHSFEQAALSVPFWAASLLVASLVAMTWRHRHEPTVRVFHLTMAMAALYPASVGLELLVAAPDWRMALLRVRFATNLFAGALHFQLCLLFAGLWRRQLGLVAKAIWVVVIVVILMPYLPIPWEYGERGPHIAAKWPYRAEWNEGLSLATFRFTLNVLLVGGLGCLAWRWRRSDWRYRSGVLVLSAAILVPSIIDASYRRGWIEASMNYSALGSAAIGAAWAWAVWRSDLLNVVPLGRAQLLEGLSDAVFVISQGGLLVDCNRAAGMLLGEPRRRWIGQPVARLEEPWRHLLETTGPGQERVGERDFDLQWSTVHGAGGAALGRMLVLHDITEILRMRRHLIEAHRMDVVGRLAGGLAHEFNNLLTVILGYAEMMEGRPAAQILEAGRRAELLTSQMLAFSGRQMLESGVWSANEIVEGMSTMLRQAAGPAAELVLVLDPEAGRLRVDRNRLEQALLEATSNAREAMQGQGRIVVRTRAQGVAQVVFEVEDNGPGVAETDRSRIFEPFYSTAHAATRPGLGLSMIHGFVTQSGGRVAMGSGAEGGARLELAFPAVVD